MNGCELFPRRDVAWLRIDIRETIVLDQVAVAFQEVCNKRFGEFWRIWPWLGLGQSLFAAVAATRGERGHLCRRSVESGRQPHGQHNTCVAGCRKIRQQMTRQNEREKLCVAGGSRITLAGERNRMWRRQRRVETLALLRGWRWFPNKLEISTARSTIAMSPPCHLIRAGSCDGGDRIWRRKNKKRGR